MWRIKPDVDVLLRDVVPPLATVDVAFLDLLASKKETAAAAKVSAHLAQLHQPVEKRYVFNYLQYLIAQQQVDQAQPRGSSRAICRDFRPISPPRRTW